MPLLDKSKLDKPCIDNCQPMDRILNQKYDDLCLPVYQKKLILSVFFLCSAHFRKKIIIAFMQFKIVSA